MEISEICAHVGKFLQNGGDTAMLRDAFRSHAERLLSTDFEHITPLAKQRKLEDNAAVLAAIFRKEDDFDRRLAQSSAEPEAIELRLRALASKTDEFERTLAAALQSLEARPVVNDEAEVPLRGLIVKAFDFYERVVLGWRESRTEAGPDLPAAEHDPGARSVNHETLDDLLVCAFREMAKDAPSADLIKAVLRQYLLSWEDFSQGKDYFQYFRMLQADHLFRDDIICATGYITSEARDLADLAVEMLRSTPTSRWNLRFAEPDRAEAIEGLTNSEASAGIQSLLQQYKDKNPVDTKAWEECEAQLAKAFACDPQLSTSLWDAFDWPKPFALVFREELRQIEQRRELANDSDGEERLANRFSNVYALAAHKQLFGVAFSGGGIRSATFNLGVLQYLAELKLLKRIDYLSTVSGGGYIGAWLAGRIFRNGNLAKVQDELSPLITPDPRSAAQKPIRFLREFSNYLTPLVGTFSFDTWTMAAVYTRNVILNQAVLFTVFATALLIPRFLAFPLYKKFCDVHGDATFMVIAAILLVVSVLFISTDLNAATEPPEEDPTTAAGKDTKTPTSGKERLVRSVAVACMLLAAYCGSVSMWRVPWVPHQLGVELERGDYIALLLFAVLSLVLSLKGGFWRCYQTRLVGRNYFFSVVVLVMITALSATAGFELLRLAALIMAWLRDDGFRGLWNAALWGPVLLLTVLIIPGLLQVGLMGVDFPDSGREWLSRFRAVCNVYTAYWIALFAAAIYGPFVILWLYYRTKIVFTYLLLWLIITITGLRAGKSRKTGLDRDKKPTMTGLEIVAKIAPPVFIAGLIILVSTLDQLLLVHLQGGELNGANLVGNHWPLLIPGFATQSFNSSIAYELVTLFVCFGGAALILAWRVDINEFSMHHFYKNRLVRCYLGATNLVRRRPNLFTGFDECDDFPLGELKAIPDQQSSLDRKKSRRKRKAEAAEGAAKPGYSGPFPIINATLNLSSGEQLAWQERKAESFVFTPCHCGFDVADRKLRRDDTLNHAASRQNVDGALKPCGYRTTRTYSRKNGPNLGTATSISGAAANPNQGYNTSPAVAFLMTVFDVRLGWWLGNPRRTGPSKLSSPVFGLAALLDELRGNADDTSNFINLSDGGHFDNMGIYELVRRRCTFIILCDAEQDPSYTFGGLGMAIRKCRIDFGAEITIDPSRIVPKEGKSESHCAVGSIKYLDGSKGTLVYIKSSITGDENEDVLEYRCSAPQFPHETTADQWFSESQFESYRALGYHATKDALSHLRRWVDWNPDQNTLTQLFAALAKIWYPVNPNLRSSASKHTATLSQLISMLRRNPGLHGLGSQLFPNTQFEPIGVGDPVGEFYFSMALLQLVEDLYFELELYREEWLKDPHIGGWRYLFRVWKRVPAVQATWNSQRSTFRLDFQRFWDNI